MPQMRLRAVADVDAQLCAQDPLLPLPRLGRVAHLGGSVCDCRPIRQDLLDQIVWQEVVRLIEDPTLIQAELDRRLDAARGAEPTKRRQDALERELTRIRKSMERLVTAYQEDLLPLDELRRRMPELRAREQSARAELQAILDQAADRMSFLRLAETLTAFLQRLHESAQSLEIADRQKIVRLLVKDILVDNDTITIRHSIPSHPRTPPPGTEPPSDGKSQMDGQGYLLRSGSAFAILSNLVLDDLDKELAHVVTAFAGTPTTATSMFAAIAPANGSWPR